MAPSGLSPPGVPPGAGNRDRRLELGRRDRVSKTRGCAHSSKGPTGGLRLRRQLLLGLCWADQFVSFMTNFLWSGLSRWAGDANLWECVSWERLQVRVDTQYCLSPSRRLERPPGVSQARGGPRGSAVLTSSERRMRTGGCWTVQGEIQATPWSR